MMIRAALPLLVLAACATAQKVEVRPVEEGLAEAGAALAEARSPVPTDCAGASRLPAMTQSVEGASLAAACALASSDAARAREFYLRLAELDAVGESERGLGRLAAEAGEATLAAEHFARATEASPEDWRAWNALGFARDALADWDGAEAAYAEAARLAPREGAPYNNRGMSLLRRGETADAAAAFAEALRRQPALAPARTNLRVARALLGEYAEAVAGAGEAERARVLNGVGLAALSRGDRVEARRLFAEALDASPVFYPAAYENLQRAAAD